MRSVSIRNILFTTCLASTFLLPFTISQGYAGFEWIPPAQDTTVKTQTPQMQMPASPPVVVNTEGLQPMNSQTFLPNQAPERLLPLEPLPGIDDLAPPPSRAQPLAARSARAPAPAETVIKVRDFGDAPMDLTSHNKEIMDKNVARRMPPKVMDIPAPVTAVENPLPELPSLIDENANQEGRLMVRNKIVMPEDAPKTARQSFDDVVAPSTINSQSKIETAPVFETVPVPATPMDSDDYEIIEGFANNIPLALALSQIVPANYSFSFAESINVGQQVSWEGGKPWTDIVEDMIRPLNLASSIRGNVLHVYNPSQISRTQKGSAPVMALTEPAAGEAPLIAKLPPSSIIEAADANQRASQHRRMNIKDPGAVKAEQPKETMAVIKDLTLVSSQSQQSTAMRDVESTPFSPESDSTDQNSAAMAAHVPVNLVSIEEDRGGGAPQALSPKPPSVEIWEAQKGDSLKRILDLWSKQANFEFVWNADHDYRLEADILVSGSFQRAVKSIFSNAISPAESPLVTVLNGDQNQRGKIIIQDDDAA